MFSHTTINISRSVWTEDVSAFLSTEFSHKLRLFTTSLTESVHSGRRYSQTFVNIALSSKY